MRENTLLAVEDLEVAYGHVRAIRGVSLHIQAGEIVGLIGANGAGKTTTLRTIMGMLKPRRGEISYQGESIRGLSTHVLVCRGLSMVPEGRRIFPSLTVLENLELGGYALSDPARTARIRDLTTVFPLLAERRHQLAGTLSGGEQQMLAIARALMTDPRLLLLDEPSMGLAPLIVAEVIRIIEEIHARGTTILLVEQNARLALQICQRLYVMELGRIALEGNAETLRESEEIRRAYLGR